MENVTMAFDQVNYKHAKNMVLYLCKHRNREVTRQELKENLHLDMTDMELAKQLKTLVKADIIRQCSTNFDNRGIQDNIFDKVFLGVYQKEIEFYESKGKKFVLELIKKEYKEALENHRWLYR